jgi:spermidine synthase
MARPVSDYKFPMTLDATGLKHGTDKTSLYHGYLGLYQHLIHNPYSILEIGIQFGNSLRTWAEAYPQAQITGIDSVDNGVLPQKNIRILIGNAYTEDMVRKLGTLYDVIIDDASHDSHDQVWFIEHYSQLLTNRGILIVEDVYHPDTITALTLAMPHGFQSCSVDMTQGKSIVDSRLFIAWRK